MTDPAAGNEEVSIDGFGKFRVKEAAAREGRSPATGETIQIAASKRMGFVPAPASKGRLGGGTPVPDGSKMSLRLQLVG